MNEEFGHKKLVDPNTGQVVYARQITKTVTPYQFWRVNIVDFLTGLGLIGSKSTKVYSFIIRHLNNRTNKLYMNYKQIQGAMAKEGTKVGYRTIAGDVEKLEQITIPSNHEPFLIKMRYGRYGRHSYLMLNPAVAMGNGGKYRDLYIHYKSANNKRHAHRDKATTKATKSHNKQFSRGPASSYNDEWQRAIHHLVAKGKIKKPVNSN